MHTARGQCVANKQSHHCRVEYGIRSISAALIATRRSQSRSSTKRTDFPTARNTTSSSSVVRATNATTYVLTVSGLLLSAALTSALAFHQPVIHNGVEALGKIWHREHFMCQNCDELLNADGKICAWEEYVLLFGPQTPSCASRMMWLISFGSWFSGLQ